MSILTLLELNLRNFKGIKHFSLVTDGENVRVFGDNATGKTTIFDAFVWLLFDKDSQNKKDFEIKTLNSDGKHLHNLEHEVEGVFALDGKTIKLKKIYFEKWTKKRGSSKQEFSGHTTDYYIDGVPSTKKDFTILVSRIVEENIFKLLTSPSYFNEQLHWQERRKTLLEIFGDITDGEVLSSDRKLSKLNQILGDRSIEDHKKVIVARRKVINQELDRIPIRIDEVERSIPDLSGLDEKAISNQIAGLKIRVEAKEAELSRIQNGGEISAKEKELREIEGELLAIKNQINADTFQKINLIRQSHYETRRFIDDYRFKITRLEDQIKQNDQSIQAKEEIAKRLRNDWFLENEKQFDFGEHQTTCYACGQELPPEQIKEAREKAEEHFNIEKSKKLEFIQSQGKAEMGAVAELKAKNEDLEKEIASIQVSLNSELEKLDQFQSEIDELQSNVQDVETVPSYHAKKQEADKVIHEIEKLRVANQESITKVRSDIANLKGDIANFEQEQAKFSLVQQAKLRISELENQEEQLAKEFEQLEEELSLIDEFTRAKVNLLEQKINSKFKYARFKLFDEQVNGALNETCVTTFNGVPYDAGLNNAARINVGLDIINTLSEHYGFSAPIFIDNSEAVTKLFEVNSQVISLVVSEADKTLRVENKSFSEAI